MEVHMLKSYNIHYTNGNNQDFARLCQMLDESLNELVGGETQRTEYNQYNKLDHIHDVILISDNDTPIACGAFKYYAEGVAEVKRVFVRKEFRGQGISKLLMQQVEDKAREQGYDSLILETGKAMKSAIGLYSSIGFQVIDNYGQYKNMPLSICMLKDIRAAKAEGADIFNRKE
jgi:GNAT superfamily N-acetyltransferase